MKIKLKKTEQTKTNDNKIFPSPSSEKRAVNKIKKSMPQTPQKNAVIIEKLPKSPHTQDILEKKGVVMSKRV